MPVSGLTVAQQLNRAQQAAKNALDEARREARETGDAIGRLSEDRDHSLSDLAKHYLPELTRQSLQKTWDESRQTIENILLRKEHHAAKLGDQLTRLESESTEAEEQLAAQSERLDQALELQQQIADQVAAALAADPSFVELTQRAAEAEAALERAEASLEQVEHDAHQKLPAYENSRLFMYLYQRGWATPKYQARGFSRRMDRWVGRLIDYPKAKIGYEYLKTTPQQVRNLVAQDRDALNVVMAELERQHDAQAEKLGMPQIVAQVAEADRDRQQTLERIAQLRDSIDRSRTELAGVESPTGTYYQEAIEYFKSLLKNCEHQTLENRARDTPDYRDDRIVAQLKHLDDQVRDVNTEAVARQQRIEWLDRHLADLGSFQHRFRMARFDSSQSEFHAGVDLDQELALVRDGRDTIDNVWMRLKARHRFTPSVAQRAGTGMTTIASNPLTHVLVNAMAAAASQAMADNARRAGGRYTSSPQRRSSGGQQRYSQVKNHRSKSGGADGFYTREKI
jgi:hypothetical protein